MSLRKGVTPSNKRIKSKSVKKVRFKETVLIYFLPAAQFNEQWLARFGVWKEAPFHDELWEGYSDKFRKKPLTKRQLTKANKEYKWRRRLPPKLYRVMFERGKQVTKISRARDEVELFEERMKILEIANRKVVEDTVQQQIETKPKARLLRKLSTTSESKSKLNSTVLKNIDNSDADLISVYDSDGDGKVETAPRSHNMKDLLVHQSSFHNESLKRQKSQVLSAFDKYEHEIERRRGSFQSGKAAEDPDNLSTVSFEMKVDGENVTVTVPRKESIRNSMIIEEVTNEEPPTDTIIEEVEKNDPEATFGQIVWALGQAVSSYFFAKNPEPELSSETESDQEEDTDDSSLVEKEAANTVKREVQEFFNASSVSLETETKEEIRKYLQEQEIPKKKVKSRASEKDI